jgi:hypothetical protein
VQRKPLCICQQKLQRNDRINQTTEFQLNRQTSLISTYEKSLPCFACRIGTAVCLYKEK